MSPFDYRYSRGDWTQVTMFGDQRSILLKGHHDPDDTFPPHIRFVVRADCTSVKGHIWLMRNGYPIRRYHDWFLSGTREEFDEFYKDPKVEDVTLWGSFYDGQMLYDMLPNTHQEPK